MTIVHTITDRHRREAMLRGDFELDGSSPQAQNLLAWFPVWTRKWDGSIDWANDYSSNPDPSDSGWYGPVVSPENVPFFGAANVLNFDGSNDYLSSYQLATSWPFTISGWFRGTDGVIWSAANTATNTIYHWVRLTSATNLQMQYRRVSSYDTINATITEDKWHHFVAEFRSTSHKEFWVDGVSIGSNGGATWSAPSNWRYGRVHGNFPIDGVYHFNGSLFDIRVYGSLEFSARDLWLNPAGLVKPRSHTATFFGGGGGGGGGVAARSPRIGIGLAM